MASSDQHPESLRRRLADAESTIDALRAHEVDAIVGAKQVSLLRLQEVEQRLRQSEARYRAIVEDQTELICRWSPDEGLLFVNRGFCRYFDAKPEDLLHRSFEKLLEVEEHPDVRKQLQELRREGDTVETEHCLRHTGEDCWLHMSHRVITSRNGRPSEIQSVGRNVTDRRRTEQALREREAQLRQLNQTLEEQVARRTSEVERRAEQLRALTSELIDAEERERRRLAHLLHDHLQQLLVAAQLRVQMLLSGDASDDLPRDLRDIQGLIRQSLEQSRSLTAELSSPVLYESGLPAALQWLGRWMHKQYRLDVDVQADPQALPVSEEAATFLFQTVRELLFNVVKHANTNSARCRLTKQDGHLRIVVEDDGNGFDAQPLVARKQGPGGFGLSTIKQRLDFIGGRMRIDSTPGQGTCITITAPAQMQAAAHALAEAPAKKKSRGDGKQQQVTRILVVDDHAVVRQGLAAMLRQHQDIEVVGEAGDGETAVRLARELQPEVVIMDVRMNGTSGIEATRAIVGDLPGVRVIGLSMHGQEEIAQAMRDAGAAAYLRKDDPPSEILTMIRAS